MAPFVDREVWFGATKLPRSTVDLEELKNCIANCLRAAFRLGRTTIWPLRAPGDHRRKNPFGAISGAISVAGETGVFPKTH